jgi:hypothetical protein
MSIKDNGGPAFPWGEHGTHLGGMTLRDYFAAKAMQSLIPIGYGNNDFNNIVVLASYRIADAMLEARKS